MEEFAPIYSPQERIFITIKWLVIGLAIFIAYNYLVKPHLVSLGSCNPENFADVQVAIYLLYVVIPALFFFVFSLLEGVRSVKIIKYGVSPLPSEKVFIKTKYVYGWRSRLKGTSKNTFSQGPDLKESTTCDEYFALKSNY